MSETVDSASAPQRLMSLDALRGFDMFWIIGAESLVWALNRMTPSKPVQFLTRQLEHVEWEGFRFYDLIFPLFVFIAGVSLVFSLNRITAQAGRGTAVKRVIRRSILLFVLGIIYYGGLSSAWPDIRLMGVLNRIALAYLFSGLLYCFLKPRALAIVAVLILLGYWAALALIPVRDIRLDKQYLASLAEQSGDSRGAALLREPGNPSAIKNSAAWATAVRLFNNTTNRVTGRFEKGLNLANHFDFKYLPGRKYDVFYDPEGILSTFPAVVTCLLGVFAGLLLSDSAVNSLRKVTLLIACGVGATLLGWMWNPLFPVIKKIWTSSYVLVAGGYSAVLLGLFYLVVDVLKLQGWCQPFVWIGMNSITVYMAANFIGGFRRLASRLVGGDVQMYLNEHVLRGTGDMLVSIVGLLLMFWFVNFLYRKRIFLRV